MPAPRRYRARVLEAFHPTVATWFRERLGEPSSPQQQGWPRIAAGDDVLIAAPTGSGKTLAAFLHALDALLRHGRRVADPLWALPLWDGYDDEIASKIADINNVSGSTFAGAIIGGLFLRRFVTEARDWLLSATEALEDVTVTPSPPRGDPWKVGM
jgi:hypothetical protein